MHIAVEGLPAVGKSELLAVLRLYYPEHVVILPELVKEVAEGEGLDLLRDRDRLTEALWARVGDRERAIREALGAGKTVVEESHLGVHAAYAVALGDRRFQEEFANREGDILWPDTFVRLAAPIPVSVARQAARGDPRYAVPADVLERMLAALDDWHLRRRSDLRVLDADRPPVAVLSDLVSVAGLAYRPPALGEVIPYLFLLGRPAAGKSELIQFLTALPADERAEGYHLGHLRVADDFPILWRLFLDDDLWEEMGRGRLHSRRAGENYAVADDQVWPFLILRLQEELTRNPARPGETVVVEFARGGPTAYRDALVRWSPELLRQAAILYLDVPFAESWRRNIARYDRARRAGILTHSVPREEMERTYAVDDWASLAPRASGYAELRGVRIPYVTVPNVPEPVTGEDFAHRFRPALSRLWDLSQAR